MSALLRFMLVALAIFGCIQAQMRMKRRASSDDVKQDDPSTSSNGTRRDHLICKLPFGDEEVHHMIKMWICEPRPNKTDQRIK